jgi:hypothetical protein
LILDHFYMQKTTSIGGKGKNGREREEDKSRGKHTFFFPFSPSFSFLSPSFYAVLNAISYAFIIASLRILDGRLLGCHEDDLLEGRETRGASLSRSSKLSGGACWELETSAIGTPHCVPYVYQSTD